MLPTFRPFLTRIVFCLGSTVPLEVKVAEDHGKQKAAYYAGFAGGPQEVTFYLSLIT